MTRATALDRTRRFIPLAVVAVAITVATIAAWRAGWFEYERVARGAQLVRARQDAPSSALAFVGFWAIATSLGFPAVPLLVAGGAVFGVALGTLLSLVGTAFGAVGGYLLARIVAPDLIRRWLARRHPLDELAEGRGILAIARLRVLPFVPFSAVTYAAGLARVPLRPYLLGTLIGQLPSTLIYSWFADRLLRNAARGGGAVARDLAIVSVLLLLLALVPVRSGGRQRH